MSFGKTRVQILKEVSKELPDNETLCLQQVYYDHGNCTGKAGYRFIRRDSAGKLKPQRGQADLTSLGIANDLIVELEKIAMHIS